MLRIIGTMLLALSIAQAESLIIENPELAGISGFREFWDQPIVLAEDGATRDSNHGRFGSGPVGDWTTDEPGAIVFDAVHRSLLVRFPQAAEQIAARLREGATIEKVELLLPFRDTEYFPMHYDRPAGMSFLGDMWVKQPPRWHAQAWALRRPWTADPERGPTWNAAVDGRVYWSRFGAQSEADRHADPFGPAEVSHAVPEGRMDVTASLLDPTFGESPAQRLRAFADHGLLIKKWELYDARYWKGGYEWGVATGQRGIRIGEPRLEVTFSEAEAQPLAMPPPTNPRQLAESGAPTAVMPSPERFAQLAEQFAFTRPAWANDWQWQRLQELHAMGGGHGFVDTYDEYLQWVDSMLSLHPRAWKGFSAGEMAAQYSMYHEAIPEPAKENLRLYWTAWLMPGRDYDELVHGYIGGKEAQAYYQKTGDWRGNFSVYRTYLHSMGTVNFNSWATTGAMFGGWIIGDEGIMEEARKGYDRWMTRTWTWMDGSSQESIDHYYFAHTLGPLKVIKDFAPGAQERLAGRLNVEKHVDELIACWHPNLRRFISSSGRTGIAYPLYLQEGLNYIMHTLAETGALTDVGADVVAERKEGAFATQLSPGQVALQTQPSPWAGLAAARLVDEKPLPYRAIRSYVQWGSYSQTPLWKSTYLGHHYGLASIDLSRNEMVPVMAQWRRTDAPVTSWRDLGTLLARYGINNTEFLDSIWHESERRNPNGIVGVQGGPTLTVQGDNCAIILGSPVPDLKLPQGRPLPAEINSLQMSLALFNFEAAPSWTLYLDGQPVDTLPVKATFGQRITVHDGVTFLGIIPLPATRLGSPDTEVLISAKGEPTEMQGGGKVKVTLTIDAYNYRDDTPLKLRAPDASDATNFNLEPVTEAQLDRAVAGFIVQLGDATEHASIEAFTAWLAALPLDTRQDEDGVYHVSYGPEHARLEAGFNPTAPLTQPTTQAFPYRRFRGAWPYLPKGVHRDTTTAMQSVNGRLEKNGAVLTAKQGTMAYLQAFPDQQIYVAMNPYLEPVPFHLETPGGVIAEADGLLGQARVELRPRSHQVHVALAAGPPSDDPRMARTLIVRGLSQKPVATLDGNPVEVTEHDNAWHIPLVTTTNQAP